LLAPHGLGTDASWRSGATLGNLEQVTSGGATVHHDYAQDRLVSTSVVDPSNVAKTILSTISLHDHAGRLTSKQTSGRVETEGFVYRWLLSANRDGFPGRDDAPVREAEDRGHPGWARLHGPLRLGARPCHSSPTSPR